MIIEWDSFVYVRKNGGQSDVPCWFQAVVHPFKVNNVQFVSNSICLHNHID
jgi:hypothetical protein